jgi:hypothetical protein
MSQQGAERAWWWKVAMHLDEAQLAINKVLVHNVGDPTPVHMLHGKLQEAQVFLLEIFRWKGMLPSAPVAPTVAGLPSEHMPTVQMSVGVPPKYSAVVPEDAILPHDTSLPQAAILPNGAITTSKIAEDGWVINDMVPCSESPEASRPAHEPMASEGPENGPSSEGSDVG